METTTPASISTLHESSPPFLLYRRSEASDIPKIRRLIDGGENSNQSLARTLQRRYGNDYDIEQLIHSSPLCIVATDKADTQVFGFIAYSFVPPAYVTTKPILNEDGKSQDISKISIGSWDSWLQTIYSFKDVKVHNTAFIAFLCTEPDHSVVFLETALTTAFQIMTNVKFICYFLPDSLILFPPLSSPRHQTFHHSNADNTIPDTVDTVSKHSANTKIGDRIDRRRHRTMHKGAKYFTEIPILSSNVAFSLHVCHRQELLPTFRVRKARVEDCDDLIPMLRKQNLLKEKHVDYFLAGLVESKSEGTKTLVAEADGQIIGFMSINRDFNQKRLINSYELEVFDDLKKDTTPFQTKSALQTPDSTQTENFNNQSISSSDYSLQLPTKQTAQQSAETKEASLNAFCIDILCIEHYYASYSAEFLRGAFSMFKAREYCLISLPPNTPEIKLLAQFSTVQAKNDSVSPHNLYIANRFGLGDLVDVRTGKTSDLVHINALTQGLKNQSEIMMAIEQILRLGETTLVVYVVEILSQIVGVVVLKICLDPQQIIDQYQVEMFTSLKQSPVNGKPIIIEHMIINPLFEVQSRWILQEIMRQAECPCLLYLVDTTKKTDFATQRLTKYELVPVKRRRMIQYPDNLRDGIPVPSPLPFNLQIITPSIVLEQRISINSRIVVIGESNVGIAFLEKLVYSTHLKFTHLTLISTQKKGWEEFSQYFPTARCYTKLELKQIALDYYVRVVYERAKELDRESKLIKLGNGQMIQYDYLVLCPGLQFNVSKLDVSLSELGGVFSMNKSNIEDIQRAIKLFNAELESLAVIFGRSVQAYATVEMMLNSGVSPSRIVLVDPTIPSKATCFNNPAVEKRVFDHLEKIGVKHYQGYRIYKWGVNETTAPKSISGIVLLNRQTNDPIRLPMVDFLLYADERSVDNATFKLINESSLVFDGRLVIDQHFLTNDPFIFGAGSVTKYASRYNTHWSHIHYDSKEIGTKLANIVLQIFDPTIQPQELVDYENLPEFKDAKKCEAMLPGSNYYITFDRPHLPGQLELERNNPVSYGRDLVIDTDKLGYFSIHMDTQGYITSITYIGTHSIPIENILCLYGLHEKYLNRLVARFDEGIITDFVKFLNEPWALPLYHDRFPQFVRSSREEGMAEQSDEMKAIIAQLEHHVQVSKQVTTMYHFAEGWLMDGYQDSMIATNALQYKPSQCDEQERAVLYKLFDQSPDRKKWDAKVFEFMFDTGVFHSYP
ncbi:hypothetical protein QVD99_002641 [Batrachochytrium dendrobatidis]|nr:hypothetical protein QVD99_002641 [Batrachochytrium dendrobatidis]